MKNICIDCKKIISKKAKRCKSCAKKGDRHPLFGINREGIQASGYIDGRTSKQYYCKCGNKITYCTHHHNGMCRPCWNESRKGKNAWNYKPLYTTRVTYSGYTEIKINSNKWIKEHRYLVEKYIGRKLKKEELIHHIDGNKRNNKLENLYIFNNRWLHNSIEALIYNNIISYKILKSNLKQIKDGK